MTKNALCWTGAAAIVLIAVAVVVLVPKCYPELFVGTPRNQYIDSGFVEHNVRIGMTLRQVEAVLGLPRNATRPWTREHNGQAEVEIVGSSPPWRRLPAGCHSISLYLDKRGRVTGGGGSWYDPECIDDDSLQLSR